MTFWIRFLPLIHVLEQLLSLIKKLVKKCVKSKKLLVIIWNMVCVILCYIQKWC